MEKVYKLSKIMAFVILGLALLSALSFGIYSYWSTHQVNKIEEARSQKELLDRKSQDFSYDFDTRWNYKTKLEEMQEEIWKMETKLHTTRWMFILPFALLFLAAFGSLLCYFIMLLKRTGNSSKLKTPIILGMISSGLCLLLSFVWGNWDLVGLSILTVISISAFIASFIDGFYLFTFWSSKQTEPINLPDNRCLTFGLRVQRYDYFFT